MPLRRSSPLIEACEAMKRCASSDSDISSENSATACWLLSAAYSAKLAISALLWTTMSSATKLCSPGTVRSNVSCSPRYSIDATSSHHRSDVASAVELATAGRLGEPAELRPREAA